MENQENIQKLTEKLDSLMKRQEGFLREIYELKQELKKLKSTHSNKGVEDPNTEPIIDFPVTETLKEPTFEEQRPPITAVLEQRPKKTGPSFKIPTEFQENIEKFIGENLISKIGILITVIGVGIGAKYAIDNELISPLTRVILGYLVGLGLLGFAFRLKEDYENFSAVLLSGAMAILYFMTFAAYSFYSLFPQAFAFVLMVLFTVFTVLAAINYNKQVIAHIGLVGAYAVPFLLSNDSGNTVILFAYMAIINAGILFISFLRNWKPLYYVAFTFTWLIFFSWYAAEFDAEDNLSLGLVVSTIFFLLFYTTFLAYKLVKKDPFKRYDIIVLLLNAFIYFGLGYLMLEEDATGVQLLGIFTLLNAIIHFGVSALVYKQKLADQNLLYLLSGLVLVFITIAIPVQLDGNWVTLSWLGLTILLFWLGRTKFIPFYEKLSYPLLFLSFFSLVHDWDSARTIYSDWDMAEKMLPIFNIYFLTGLLFAAGLAYLLWLNTKKEYTAVLDSPQKRYRIIAFAIPALFVLVVYNIFRIELDAYWTQLYHSSRIQYTEDGGYSSYYMNYDIRKFGNVWAINYSLLFMTLLSFINIRWLKHKLLSWINLGFNVLLLLAFLTSGLILLSQLQDSYVSQELAENYNIGSFNISVRYVSYLFVAALLFATYKYIRQSFVVLNLRKVFDYILHGTILWIATSELINWTDFYQPGESYKLGLSILWGLYALFLIVLGIWKKKKHLRIASIVLFSITLMKLFFYDISHLNTISKTIVFVSLGILLLIISFLYNKYKHIIFDEDEH